MLQVDCSGVGGGQAHVEPRGGASLEQLRLRPLEASGAAAGRQG